MIRSTLGASIGAALVIATPAMAQRGGDMPKLLPLPQSLTRGSGTLTIAAGAGVGAETPLAQPAATLLIDHVRTARGIALAPAEAATARIRFVADPSIKGDEAYRLTVARDGVRVAASAAPGFVHGAMTLVQLLSPDARFGQPVRVPAVTIEDSPRFAWRGLMLDTARHFLPLPEVEKIVDQMAAVKLNTLHLHLSDDQGWRFEVKRYPKLTEVGAWRTPPSTGSAAPTQRYGGFYTQDELRGLVRYAADRGITIVPEIDLPGHAQALVAAYPEFGVLGDRPETGNGWGIFPYLLDPGPKGVAFVKQVLDELIQVFPGTYVHLGGDEAVKDQWERSPAVQAQIKALHLKDENALQSWLIDELGTYLSSKGRRLIGWDEILEGGLPPSASVMSWRGEKGAVDAANQNHDVVLSPAPTMYINYLQSHRADEPPGPIQVQTLADTYAYDPMPKGLDPAKAGHVLGAQMNLWSEYLVTPYQYQHSIFPRLAALAENSWIERPRDFAGFLTRLQPQVARWKRGGVEVADSSAAVDFRLAGTRGEALRGKKVSLTLAQDAPQGTIRYTLDGSAPTPKSRRYAAPLSLGLGQTVRAAPFDAAGIAFAAPRAFDTGREALLTRVSGEMAACPGETRGLRVPLTADATANAPTYDVNIFNLCSAYPAAPLDVAGGFTVEVARLARNHGLAHDFDKVRRHFNVTPHGELLVMLGCPAMKDGKPVPGAPRPVIAASFPLPDPASAPQRQRFTGTLPAMDGDRDLCFQFTSPLTEPLYAVERVSLTDRR